MSSRGLENAGANLRPASEAAGDLTSRVQWNLDAINPTVSA